MGLQFFGMLCYESSRTLWKNNLNPARVSFWRAGLSHLFWQKGLGWLCPVRPALKRMPVQDFNPFSIMFFHIISTTYQRIGDLFWPVYISGLSHSVNSFCVLNHCSKGIWRISKSFKKKIIFKMDPLGIGLIIGGLVMVTLILVGCGWFKRGGSGGGSW